MSNETEPEILAAQRAFPESQRLLAGEPNGELTLTSVVGWHDVSMDPRAGAFAVAAYGGPFAEEIGRVLRISANGNAIFAYLVGRATVEDPISLSRRAFLALAPLRYSTLTAKVEAVE